MSRSNPTQHNPAQYRFNWKSGKKCFVRYNREDKTKTTVKLPFTFIPLDQLSTVTGYQKRTNSSIYANEVRDTRVERLVVKSSLGNVIADGLWMDIKDKVAAAKAGFAVIVYCAFKDEKGGLKLASIQMSGCARSSWFDFTKKHSRSEIESKAVRVSEVITDDSGEIAFNAPVFELVALSDETNAEAVKIDQELQNFLKGYFSRTTAEKVDVSSHAVEKGNDDAPSEEDDGIYPLPDDEAGNVPF